MPDGQMLPYVLALSVLEPDEYDVLISSDLHQ